MLTLALACLLGCGSSAWKPTQRVTHPAYALTVELPEGWSAEAGHNALFPSDTWILKPTGGDVFGPAIHILVGWLPRGGRQSAFFPGGRLPGGRAGTLMIAGRKVPCLIERNVRLTDFEVGSLALSVRAHAPTSAAREVIDQVLAHMTIDGTGPLPPAALEKRKALDLVSAYAHGRGLRSFHIVHVGPGEKPGTHGLTIFHAEGIIGVVADPRKGTVTVDEEYPAPPK